jgi:hypothetical protein
MSNTKMNTTDFEAKVMAELAEIKNLLANKGTSTPSMKEKKARKPRDPDAPPNPWIVFTGRVRAALKAAGKPAGKECQQFASFLKAEFKEDAYTMEDSEILAAHADWTPPPPKPKDTAEEDTAAKSEPEEKPKRKGKPLTEEHKAKMAEGRRIAAERKKAEKAAAAAAKTEDAEEAEEVEEASPPKPVKPAPTLKTLPFNKKILLHDPVGNGAWLKNKDGSKGEWQGILEGTGTNRTLNTSAKDYTA